MEKKTYYVVSRSGEIATLGNQKKEPSGYFVTTSREKAIKKQKEILDKREEYKRLSPNQTGL